MWRDKESSNFPLNKNFFKQLNNELFSIVLFPITMINPKEYIDSSLKFIDITKMNRKEANDYQNF